ncbi:hypothetical protein, variant [Verruconis gallopava]|uniref:Transcription factor BYE1 n=1 Tax=Verruconis gallopava TaxID=253628 RepID=A0A0D1XNS2_9PEZI|nr:hypothetical protein, variant [Verruconis gallopava]KIW04226.1 hypothetical protein, variant [Verruconis gallopava]
MAEEPRRSGRATKGQHTKNDDELLTGASAASTAAASGQKKGKASKKNKVDEPSDLEVNEEDDSIIRCVCGATADEDGWQMICCEKCEAWQHNLCMGVTEVEEEQPEKYYCEQCRPSNHKVLLAAMKRGEKPWEARIKARKEEEEEAERRRKGKKGKGGSRKSAGGKETPAKGTPVPEGTKRKAEEEHVAAPKSASPVVAVTPSNNRRKSSTQVIPPDAKRRKSTADGISHSRKSSTVVPLVSSIEELPGPRQNAPKALSVKIKSVIDQLVKDGRYRIPDGETASSLATTMSLQIENSLMTIYGEPSAYKTQFLAIHSNIPKNTELVAQLLSGSLTPMEIADMSSDDMASEEVQRERARAKEEADKQSILITEQVPRMRKTHKGDEIIGEDMTVKPVEDASWATQPIRRRDTHDENMTGVDGQPQDRDSPDRVELPETERHIPPPLSVDTKSPHQRKQSGAYNMDRVWGAAHSPDRPHDGAVQTPRMPQAPAQPQDAQMHDADIDRLLKDEDDDDQAPISPVVDGSPGSPVWKGLIDMAGVASFNASARWVAGGDVGQKVPYTDLIPGKMEITGRIAIPRADEYVAGMRFSQSNDVCCLLVTPSSRSVDRESFNRIFDYFHSKQRWGVINGTGLHEAVRDCYLVTLEAGSGGWPDFMSMLEERHIEEPRPENMLVLTMVVKTKSPHSTPAPAMSSTPQIPQQSPVVPQNGSAGPIPPQAPTPVTYPWATDTVKAILGPEIHAPAVVQLFTAVPEMSEIQVRNLREALEREPSAREDLGRLGEVLRAGVQ